MEKNGVSLNQWHILERGIITKEQFKVEKDEIMDKQ